MKNLMKLSFYLLFFTFLLGSCGGESSTKGNWSSSDIERCKDEGIVELENDDELNEMMDVIGSTSDEFVSCVCETLEEKFDSYNIADVEMNAMTDEESVMVILSCFGDLEDLIKLGMEME